MASETYNYLNKAWKSTCRVLFGEDIGELSDYEEWLSEYVPPPRQEQSAVSGRTISLAEPDYCAGARFAAFSELDFSKKFEPLSINEVKDIDSVLSAVRERLYYAGDIILGNSKFVEDSASVVDSHFVLGSSVVSDSKYIAYSGVIRICEYIFGTHGDAQSSFSVKCNDDHKGTRCFECYTVIMSSDCHYCVRCQDVRECMFSFGVRSKSHCIGNLPLNREKYAALKKKLMSEMAGMLKKEKRIFSLLEVAEKAARIPAKAAISAKEDELGESIEPMEEAFSRTASLLLGKKLSGLDSYAAFLKKHVNQSLLLKSPFSGKRAILAGYLTNLASLYKIAGCFVTENEMIEVGKVAIGEDKAGSLTLQPERLAHALRPIAYLSLNDTIGTSRNLIDCSIIGYAEDCYRVDGAIYSKKCAYSWWPRESEHIFGSGTVWASSFCLKCFLSKRLTRAFEADNCENSADLYYSHNCENMQDAMFCFNVKNQRHTIGNAPLEPEKYRSVKKSLLEQISNELEEKKDLKLDIFNIGCAGKKK